MRIIAGIAGGRTISAPRGTDTRPTLDRVRENLFNMLQGTVGGSRVLDLFAGSGALSLEAVSRGALSATLVDHDRKAHAVQRQNIAALRWEDRTETLLADWREALRILAQRGERYDLVFLDPPYAFTGLPEVFSGLRTVLEKDALIVVEHEGSRPPAVPEGYELIRSRKWGYCGVSFFQTAERTEMEG